MSVQKTPTGYLVRWREDGRQRGRRFTRKGDADAWDREVKRRQQLGPLAVQQMTSKGPTLGEWIVERWGPEHGVNLATRTRTRYAQSYDLHIGPELDLTPLRELTVARLRAWQAGRLKDGVSVSEVRHCRVFLSSVLRHAAESEAIAANPMGLVRAPKAAQADEVVALAPSAVEAIRAVASAPMARQIADAAPGKRARRGFLQPDSRAAPTMLRDAALVSLLAYAGVRPGEALALRWQDVGERTLLIQRATDSDGSIKTTKGRSSRSVRLLDPLAHDLKAWNLAAGRPAASALVFPRADGKGWTTEDWGNWRGRTWRRACEAAGVEPVPRPYDLRHSFASLLLAEGRTVHYVAGQLGHSPEMTLTRYGHVMAEFADAEAVDAVAEIRRARSGCAQNVHTNHRAA